MTTQPFPEHIAFRTKTVVLNRLGRLEELASAVLFLVSDDASYITGHTLYVDVELVYDRAIVRLIV
jgi:NAD(P)-dependent dehydrogenase (short-subunit alcohol dehydrogenase family)